MTFAQLGPAFFPWALHISDGILQNRWVSVGFGVAGLLMLRGAYRVRDEDIPRIALLTSAFFVVSLIHVRLGPTSVHLLFNGLVGVILGWRACLAIPLGLFLQAALVGHGGLTSLGVNACVLTLPALLARGIFVLAHRSLLFSNARFQAGGDFLIGMVVGATAVLATLTMNATALLWGGAEDWQVIVLAVFVAHLPVVVLEGLVTGFTVSFLARVKTEMLGLPVAEPVPSKTEPDSTTVPSEATRSTSIHWSPPSRLLALILPLLVATPAQAHRLEADFRSLPDRRVQIESWFDLGGDSPLGATVQVWKSDGTLLVQGRLDERGLFVFSYPEAQTFKVVLSAGGSHRKELVIPASALAPPGSLPPKAGESPTAPVGPFADRSHPDLAKEVLLGVSFVLALAAFVLSLRNARTLREWQRARQENGPGPVREPSAPEDAGDNSTAVTERPRGGLSRP